MSSDTLSEVLRAVRLKGAIFFAVDATVPWVIDTPESREIAPHIMPGVEHVIEYHVITQGSCWGGIVGQEPIRLQRGDVIVFPQGDAHVMSSTPSVRGIRDDIEALAHATRLPVTIRKDGGGSERAGLICGFLGFDARPFNPLVATLPSTLHVPRANEDGALEALVKLALAESSSPREGGEAVLTRVSELLFIEMVRRYLAQMPPEGRGWLAGLRDESVGRVLEKLHEQSARDWTLGELARETGLSRSVLAERFMHFVGIPPMQYLARWRVQLAASLLVTTSASLAEIAERVGYGSETALSRAFKRWVSVAPGEWRRTARNSAGPGGS